MVPILSPLFSHSFAGSDSPAALVNWECICHPNLKTDVFLLYVLFVSYVLVLNVYLHFSSLFVEVL